jgi:hypothetical protein
MVFTHGEEELLNGERFVISAREGSPPTRYRLLASGAAGPRVVWASPRELTKIDRYTRARDDTDRIMGRG